MAPPPLAFNLGAEQLHRDDRAVLSPLPRARYTADFGSLLELSEQVELRESVGLAQREAAGGGGTAASPVWSCANASADVVVVDTNAVSIRVCLSMVLQGRNPPVAR